MAEKFEGFNFDGFNSKTDMGLYVAHVAKPIAPEISNSRQSVPGMYGDINLGNGYGAKTFNITVSFLVGDDDEAYNDYIHNLAAYLIRDADEGAEYPLIFGDEPDVTYYGIFTSIPEATAISEGSNDGQLQLVFTCSDPQGYGEEINVTVDQEPFSITPEGTGTIAPVYYIVPTTDVYEVAVAYDTTDDQYIDVGAMLDATEADTVIDTNPVLVNDPCNTFATWKTLTTPPFDMANDIDGTFATNTNSISVKKDDSTKLYDYGDPAKHAKKWFGPMVMHENLTDAVHDFKLSFRLHHIKRYGRAISKTEVYLVDDANKRVGRIFIEDVAKGASSIMGLYLGDPGHEVKVFRGHYGKMHNGANTGDKVTIVKKGTKKVKTGKGSKTKYKTKTTYSSKTEILTDYHNSDYFNDAFVQFDIQKSGSDAYISAHVIKDDGSLGGAIVDNKKVTLNRDFALLTIAYYAARYPIKEDETNPQTHKPQKTYNYGFNSITGYKVSALLDNPNADPVLIAHAGDTIILNSESKHAYLATFGGTISLDKYVSFGSSFPTIKGGQLTNIAFSPSFDEASITLTYRPTYK